MHKQIIHISTFLACFAFHFASAQTAPKNPNTFTLQEVIDCPTVGWASPFHKSWGAGGISIELEKGIQVATQKFVKGKKVYTEDAKPLSLAALQKMNFVEDYITTFDPDDFTETVTPIMGDKQGVAETFRIEGQYFYDKAQNSMGFVADKIYLRGDKANIYIENAIVNYKQKPQHLTPLSLRYGDVYMPFKPEKYIGDYLLSFLKNPAGVKVEKNDNKLYDVSDAEMQQCYGDAIPHAFKSALYWDETTQQFGLFVDTFEFQMPYKDKPSIDRHFQKPAAH